MGTSKISGMSPATTPLDGTELLEVSQLSGGSYATFNATSLDLAYAASKYGIFYSLVDQTYTASTATVVKLATTGIATGISIANNGSGDPTRITFEDAGVYEITCRLQFANSDTSDHVAHAWFRLDGTDIPNSSSKLAVPKAADGGAATFAITGLAEVTAGQYMEITIAVDNAGVSLDYTASTASPYVSPATPSAILTAKRISL